MKREQARLNERPLRRVSRRQGVIWLVGAVLLVPAKHAAAGELGWGPGWELGWGDEPGQAVIGAESNAPWSESPLSPGVSGDDPRSLPDLEGERVAEGDTPENPTENPAENEDESEGFADSSDFDLFHFGYRGMDTSDAFRDNTVFFDYRTKRRDLFWPWEEASSRTLDGGVSAEVHDGSTADEDFRSWRLAGLLGKRILSASYVEAELGVHRLSIDGVAGSDVVYPVRLKGVFGIAHGLTAEYEADRDFVYDELIPGGISQALIATDQDLSVLWQPVQRIRVTAAGGYRDLSDSNNRTSANFAVMYGISPEWPWIWVGGAGETLSYEDESEDYWSPSRYAAYGLRLDSSFPVSGKLDVAVAANLDRIVEEDGEEGTGDYVSAGLDYKLSNRLYLRGFVSRGRSLQRGSEWRENRYGLTISGALF